MAYCIISKDKWFHVLWVPSNNTMWGGKHYSKHKTWELAERKIKKLKKLDDKS